MQCERGKGTLDFELSRPLPEKPWSRSHTGAAARFCQSSVQSQYLNDVSKMCHLWLTHSREFSSVMALVHEELMIGMDEITVPGKECRREMYYQET